MTSFANTESLPEATPVIPAQRGTTPDSGARPAWDCTHAASKPAAEFHPSWCVRDGHDSGPEQVTHASKPIEIPVLSAPHRVGDDGAVFPVFLVCGYLGVEDGIVDYFAVEVTVYSPDVDLAKPSACRFTKQEARHFAEQLATRVEGSVAATGGYSDRVSAVRLHPLAGGFVTLSGGIGAYLAPTEAAQLAKALLECAALPVDVS